MELGRWLRLAWDRAAAVVLIVLGAAALVLGWIGVSGEAFPAKQLPYLISGGIAGVFILGLGALFWLSADLRDEWTKLDRIEAALNRLADTGLVDVAAKEPESIDLVESAAAADGRRGRRSQAAAGLATGES